MATDTLTTGEVADRADVNIQTVRYYERRGLLPEPPRSSGGFRQYSPDYVDRIRFVKRAQELGFTLDQADQLLDLQLTPDADRAEVRAMAEDKIEEVEAKIRDLQRIRDTLGELVEACEGHGTTSECPILDAIEEPAGTDVPSAEE